MMRPAPDDRHPGGGPDPVLVFLIAVVASRMCMFITLSVMACKSSPAFTSGSDPNVHLESRGRWSALQRAAAAALFAVTLGLLLQFGPLGAPVWADSMPPTAKTASDVTGGIAWSTVVCSGIALGIAAGRHRERLMGLLGLVCAPTAFALAVGPSAASRRCWAAVRRR